MSESRAFLIAVAGPSGSGKTSLAQALIDRLPDGQAVFLSADRYYRDLSHLPEHERNAANFDDPEALEHQRLAADLERLKHGQAVEAPGYDYASHTRSSQTTTISAAPYVVVEGNFLLAWPDCRDLFDLRIFISASHKVCLERRLQRDVVERGRDEPGVHAQYENTVRPMCDRYIMPSAMHADILLDARSSTALQAERVLAHLERVGRLRRPGALSPGLRGSLIEELDARLEARGALHRRYLWKKLAWTSVVRGTLVVKRAIDVLGAGGGLILLSPLFAVLALAIKMTDGGPVFYVGKRVGRWGREFPFPKFRSMVVNADKVKDDLLEQNVHGEKGVTFKMKRDPRVTRVGRFMRRTSFDELPQLWSVLVGDMTLVGPRPPVPREVAEYSLRDRRRLDVTPGITCIWQVSGRSDIAFPEQVELDVQYIESRSLWLDIVLLARTIPAVLLGKGAY